MRKILKRVYVMGKIMAAKVDDVKCTGCGTCVDSCPVDAIKVNDLAKIDEDECIDCGTCVDECPEGAISLE
jgi:ferredoxin